jgi:cytoskeletal protein RodZ
VGAFGERLKREREKRKITLDEVAQATKIGTRLLSAIEQEQFKLLPGGIFNKGFVRSYARYLGLNEEETVASYLEALSASQPQEQSITPEAEARKIMEQRALRVHQQRRRVEHMPWGKAAIALLLVALGLALWNTYLRHEKTATAPENPAPNVVVTAPEQLSSRADSTKSLPVLANQPDKSTTENQPATESAPTSPDSAVSSPGLFHVIIRAREDSWIQVTVDGKEVLQDTLLAQSQRSVDARNELIIKAGNIGALEFWFNGQKLPSQGDLDQVKTVTFDASGLVVPTAKIQPAATTVER